MDYNIDDIIEVRKDDPKSCEGCIFNSGARQRDWCLMTIWDYWELIGRGLHPACTLHSVIFKIKEK